MSHISQATSQIRRARKESQYYKILSGLFMKITMEDNRLQGMFINRVQLSPSSSACTIFFYLPDGEEAFREKLDVLKLYKPSLRKSLSSLIDGRYTPELIFKFDTLFEKQQRIEAVLEAVSSRDNSESISDVSESIDE